ncbi:MAG: cysteine desulfurase family protein [Myxococcaceae bacterium]
MYLDYNATTPLLPEVVDAMEPFLREHFGNPSSAHPVGRKAKAAVDHAREQVAQLICARPEEIVFTSGGTEANNLALFGVMASAQRRMVVTSSIEHPAISNVCMALEKSGVTVARVPVDGDCVLSLPEAKAAIDRGVALVSVMHSNNETGTLQPVEEVARLARVHGVLVHTDAAQSAGKVPLDVDALGADLLSLAGHKLYAPKGVGALFVRRGVMLRPFMRGAGQEHGARPGTENVASIVGLGVACERARAELVAFSKQMFSLSEVLWERLSARVPGLKRNGHAVARLPNTLSVRFPQVKGSAVLERSGVWASTGSACHAEVETASSVLLAMGVPSQEALGTVRLSLGRGSGLAEVEAAAEGLAAAWRAVSSGG